MRESHGQRKTVLRVRMSLHVQESRPVLMEMSEQRGCWAGGCGSEVGRKKL